MKKFFGIMLTLAVLLVGCKSSHSFFGYGYPTHTVMKSKVYEYSRVQFDSMCVEDNLDPNIKNWATIKFNDFETREQITTYFALKGKNKKVETTYLTQLKIANLDTIFNVEKRIKKDIR